MLDKYITLKEKDILVGQTSNGIWYCKELRAETETEAGKRMKQMNIELNKVNNRKEKIPAMSPKKEKKPKTKGLE